MLPEGHNIVEEGSPIIYGIDALAPFPELVE